MSSNDSRDVVLESNCREAWPIWTCICGNVCGLSSTTLWFLVLLPQVWKNFRRKSVRGLSVLWATANFTASLINLFFVFKYAKIPLYGQISSVYCPILEFTLLCQFWVYGQYSLKAKLLYVSACCVGWAAVITVELLTHVESPLEYVAIALWCVETFPQVILNMRLRSTSGQSLGSVLIATLGKTTDFCSNNVLVIPVHYVIMTYFSSSVAFINSFQVAWYYDNDIDVTLRGESDTRFRENNQGINNEGFTNSHSIQSIYEQSEHHDSYHSTATLHHQSNKYQINPKANPKITDKLTLVNIVRYAWMTFVSSMLVFFVVGFIWNVGSFYGLFAPLSIAVIMCSAKICLDKCFS